MSKIIESFIQNRTFIDDEGKTCSRFGSRGRGKIEWIVVHYTGGKHDKGKAEIYAKNMRKWRLSVSTHYLVGIDQIFHVVPDNKAAWHVGGFKSSNKCAASNSNSIGVDLVQCKRDIGTGSVEDRDWYFLPEVTNRGAHLIAELADRYGIDQDHIVRHYDVTGKMCPRPFVGDDVNLVACKTGNESWEMFLALIGRIRASKNQLAP